MNPTLKKIKQTIVDPEIQSIKHNVVGYIAAVYYQERRCDAVYFDNDGSLKRVKRLRLPTEGDGLFKETLKAGDKVELAFRNKTSSNMFISRVYKQGERKSDFYLHDGQQLPRITQLF